MAQRGGAVQSHLRLSRNRIWSDLIPRGGADMILSVEPLEALRYLEYLHPRGKVVSSSTPLINIPNYPGQGELIARIRQVEGSVIVDAESVAKEAGSSKTQNTVVLGAAARYLAVREESLLEFIRVLFAPRGERILEVNLKAFELGRKAS
jgi:indolepyruvate ferredoxin oxidoreductase beta subunit